MSEVGDSPACAYPHPLRWRHRRAYSRLSAHYRDWPVSALVVFYTLLSILPLSLFRGNVSAIFTVLHNGLGERFLSFMLLKIGAFFSNFLHGSDQGCGVGVETGGVGVGVGVLAGAGVGKIWPTPTPAWSRRLTPGDRIGFWTDDYAPSRKH